MAREKKITTAMLVKKILPRRAEGHKYDFGHALLVCGSESMTGAAVLAVGGALRSGCGLVTLHTPATAAMPTQANHPSAMLSIDKGKCLSQMPADIERYNAIGIGCGVGCDEKSAEVLSKIMESAEATMVIDADALNMIAGSHLVALIPDNAILTPHRGELERLTGEWSDEKDMMSKATALASATQCVVVVKGAPTRVITPSGQVYVNTSGNAGMAKGGSGDVLTGLITGLVARGYESTDAAILGVWLHGVAGDKASQYYGAEAMNSGDMADFLSEAFLEIK